MAATDRNQTKGEEHMKRFLIDTSVENAQGTQTWFVDAETEQEALDKFSDGDCDLYESNVEVTRCGEPEISGEVPLDDFGRFAEQPPAAQPAPVQEPVAALIDENQRLRAELKFNTLPAQPAVQEPVASLKEVDVLMMAETHGIDPSTKGLYGFYIDCISNQPAAPIPDAITDDSESPEYRSGWNECREAMMEMMK
jgi:hypothetical protein